MRWTTEALRRRSDTSVHDIQEQDMHVAFQPIVDLVTGATFAQEALARCQLPAFRSPLHLFEQAEEEEGCGRLGRIIRNVLFQHCSEQRVFINVHPQELSQRWLVQPTDPLFLHDHEVFIEVTEAAAFDYFDICLGVLSELRARCGAKVVVDDFGAGHSDFKRVLELKPDVVKLDMSLVRGIELSLERQAQVRDIVDNCHSLGAEVVAEGIETTEEFHVCAELGADYAQGYLLGRPSFSILPGVWPAGALRRPKPR